MKRVSLLFKITYKCNDVCSFCLAHDQMKNKIADISLSNLVKNIEYFSRKSEIIKIILTGGEPTLHPEFFNILEYLNKQKLPINVITNAIKFADKNFLAKTKFYLFNINKYNSKLIFSLNDLPEQIDDNKKQEILKKRINGIINLAKSQLPLFCVITIIKNNARRLDKIVNFLIKLRKKYSINLKLVELRMLYIGLTPDNLLEKSLPDGFDAVNLSLEKAIKCLKDNDIIYNLWNLPLCYLENPEKHKNIEIKKRLETDIIKVDTNHQCNKADILNWQKYLKDHSECIECSLRNYCSGIDSDYLYLHNYPRLRTIK